MHRAGIVTTIVVALSGIVALAQSQPSRPSPANELTRAEKAAGWKLLFDGEKTDAWRAYRGPSFPEKGWVIDHGCLKSLAGGGGGDILTTDQYGDFELTLEWRAAPKANSGIMYRVTEQHDEPWQSGPEYQIRDDHGAGLAATDIEAAGAVFDLYPPEPGKVVKPAGEFNGARIRLQGGLLQHWLNGGKAVECQLGSDDWNKRVAASKFKEFDGFGQAAKGHIDLQDHGDEVAFRNIHVRDLSAPLPNEVRLFNGKDLAGWKAVLPPVAKMEDVWSVADGLIICKGHPNGYIRTETDYRSYVLKVEWRFNPVTKQPGNSGVLLRIIGADKVWPRCVEAQLESGNAGDFWDIDEFPMKSDAERTKGRNTKKTHFAERPVGEWNEYEITVDGPRITLKVNGEVLNEAWNVLETPGKIGLQSEGAEIHFRNIRLSPLE